MDIVTALSIVERLGIITDWAEATSIIRLLQDGSSGILGGIYLQGVGSVGMGLLDNRIAQDNFLESLDGGSAARGPHKGSILLHELHQWFSNVGEPTDKWALVAKNTKRTTDLLDGGQLFRPGGQSVAFGWINTNGAVTDNDAQVLN
jgi:hypothetical protein